MLGATKMIKLFAVFLSFLVVAANYDTFNYDETDWATRSFGPEDWDQVQCHDVETCPGWPTNWEDLNDFIPYDGTDNMCMDCSKSRKRKCKRHEQSPIHLLHNTTRKCIDRHLMRYFAGECQLEDMEFRILPHSLRVYQPKNDCSGKYQPGIDFSRGYPKPWQLSFTDISFPSQHMIDGKRYDAEVILSHVYSRDRHDRLIGNLAIMLEEGTAEDKYDFLNLYFKEWQKKEDKVIAKCFPDGQPGSDEDDNGKEDGEDDDQDEPPAAPHSQKEYRLHNPRYKIDKSKPQMIKESYYKREWHPYDWYVQANTEYYFRYKGSMPEPPCFEGVHWRVLRKPVKVSPGQLRQLHNLLNNRLNPETCQKETAGKPKEPGSKKVRVNRPIQMTTRKHKLVYCACDNWKSKSKEDEDYCKHTFQS